MGTALTGQKPKDTYKDLLHLDNSNSGVDATVRTLVDGNGTDSGVAVSTGGVFGANANGGGVLDEAASATNPTIVPDRADPDTGLGAVPATADVLVLTAGAIEGFRVAESGSAITLTGAGALTVTGGVFGANAAGGGVLDEAASGTNPTLNPNKADPDTGVGSAAADQCSITAGGTEVARASEAGAATSTQFIVSPGATLGAAATPSLAFGDGDSGIYESGDDALEFVTNGNARFVIGGTYTQSNNATGWRLRHGGATATQPTLIPSTADADSGMGQAAVDEISLIAGGVEGVRILEANSTTMTAINSTAADSVTDATSAGNATLTKAGENFSTTCSVGDIVWVYGGTTVADYGAYTIKTVTSDTVLTLDRALSGSDSDVDFYVFADGTAFIESASSVTGVVTKPYTKYVDIPAGHALLGPNAPGTDVIGTFRALGFSADNQAVYLTWEVPDDWAGGDVTLKVYWAAESGDQIAQNETVKWDATYRIIDFDNKEVYDNGNTTLATTTYTEASNPGADKETHVTSITIDWDDGDNTLAKDQVVGIQFDRDVTSDTYTGEAQVVRWEIAYTSNGITNH